jgi:hypothetical protein
MYHIRSYNGDLSLCGIDLRDMTIRITEISGILYLNRTKQKQQVCSKCAQKAICEIKISCKP